MLCTKYIGYHQSQARNLTYMHQTWASQGIFITYFRAIFAYFKYRFMHFGHSKYRVSGKETHKIKTSHAKVQELKEVDVTKLPDFCRLSDVSCRVFRLEMCLSCRMHVQKRASR